MYNYRPSSLNSKGIMHYLLKNNEGGFSLVELMTAMAINLFVFGVLCAVLIAVLKVDTNQNQIVRMQQNTCIAMERLVKSIRSAGYNPRSLSFSSVSSVSTTSLRFNQDLNGDGTNEPVLYTYDSSTKKITRNINGVNTLIAGNIDSITFIPKDSSGATTYSKSAIKQIQINLTGRSEIADQSYSSNGGYRTFSLSSIVFLRN